MDKTQIPTLTKAGKGQPQGLDNFLYALLRGQYQIEACIGAVERSLKTGADPVLLAQKGALLILSAKRMARSALYWKIGFSLCQNAQSQLQHDLSPSTVAALEIDFVLLAALALTETVARAKGNAPKAQTLLGHPNFDGLPKAARALVCAIASQDAARNGDRVAAADLADQANALHKAIAAQILPLSPGGADAEQVVQSRHV